MKNLDPINEHLEGMDNEIDILIKMNNKRLFGRPFDEIKYHLKVHHYLINMSLMNKKYVKALKSENNRTN